MPVQEVNYSIFNFLAPVKAQNEPVLEGTAWSAQLLAVANTVLFYPYCYPLSPKKKKKNFVPSFVNAEKFLEGKPNHQDQKPGPNESKDCILILALNIKETFYRGSAYH